MFVTCFFCRRRRRRRRHRHRAHKHRLRDRDRDRDRDRPRPKAPPRPPGGDEAAGAGDESDDDEVLATLACFAAMPQPVLRRARDLTPQPAEIVYTRIHAWMWAALAVAVMCTVVIWKSASLDPLLIQHEIDNTNVNSNVKYLCWNSAFHSGNDVTPSRKIEWMHPSRRAPRLTGYSVLLSWLVWLADFLFLLNLIPGDAFRVVCGDNLAY